MRILLAHNNFTTLGGAEVFYHQVGRVLTAAGHEVAYFSAHEEGLSVAGAGYFPRTADYRTGGVVSKALGLPGMIYNRDARQQMARLIADSKPDIIHAFAIYVRLTPSILDAARAANVPVVLSCNDYKHICPNYKLFHHGRTCTDCKGGRFYKALVNRCCHDSLAFSAASMVEAYAHGAVDIWRRGVDCFLFASEFMARQTMEFWGEGSFRHAILRNPFDAAAHRIDGPVGDYALYFGRLIEEKGVDILLRAAALTPELPVVIIGDGPARAALEDAAKTLPNVRFLGPLWGDALNDWLRGARFIVVPSLWHENFPYVILQAFAAGKPVIGSRRGGIPELVRDGRGWTYEAEDVAALADAMRHAAGTPDAEIAAMGARAAKYVTQEFSDARFLARLEEVYGATLGAVTVRQPAAALDHRPKGVAT